MISSITLSKYPNVILTRKYLFRYMFVGDFVRGEIHDHIKKMRPSMRRKLQYIVAPHEGRQETIDETNYSNQNLPHTQSTSSLSQMNT